MDIERDLEFARKCVMVSTADIVTKTRVDETLKTIARQSVKSEDSWKELREDFMHNLRGCDTVTVSLNGVGSTDYSTEDIHNMIASLTDNQVVAKSATSEDVAEAIVILTEWRDFLSGTLPANAEGTREIMSYNLAIAALQAYQPWISVEDRLPELDDALCQLVFTWSEEKNGLAVQYWRHVQYDPDITHWKPIPEPPKGE